MRKTILSLLTLILLLALAGPGWASLPATDNFYRNESPLAGNWTTVPGLNPMQAGYDVAGTSDISGAFWNADTFTADQSSQEIYHGYGVISVGPGVRLNTVALSTPAGYCAIIDSTTQITINKISAGPTLTPVGASFTITPLAGGEAIWLGATGTSTTTLELKIDTVSQGTRTDSSSPYTSGAPGVICTYSTRASDAWTGNDITLPLPVVSTQAVTPVSVTAVTAHGTVSATNGTLSAHGFVYASGPSPNLSTGTAVAGGTLSGTGTYTADITGLSATAVTYIAAYATNENGTTYGPEQVYYHRTFFFDGVSGDDSTGDGSLATPYQTITKANALLVAGSVLPGDFIKLRKGTSAGQQTFRGEATTGGCCKFGYLYLPATVSGTAVAPITIGAYAVSSEAFPPVLASSEIISSNSLSGYDGKTAAAVSWTGPDGNGVWSMSLSWTPYNASFTPLWEDGLPLWAASGATCSDGNAYYSSGTLYYKPSSGTPANHVLEVSYGLSAINSATALTANNYITVDGLKFNREGIDLFADTTNPIGWTIQNCAFNNLGCWFNTTAAISYTQLGYFRQTTIQNNTFDYCFSGSIRCEGGGNGYMAFDGLDILSNVITNGNTFPGPGAHNGLCWVDSGDYDPIVVQTARNMLIKWNDVSHSIIKYADGSGNLNNCAIHYFLGGSIGGGTGDSGAIKINSAENASGQIRIVIEANLDYLKTGDRLSIWGTGGAADGIWIVTAGADSTHWVLDGSTYAANFTGSCGRLAQVPSTGNVIAYNWAHDMDNDGQCAGIWVHGGPPVSTAITDSDVQVVSNIVAVQNSWAFWLVGPMSASGKGLAANNTAYAPFGFNCDRLANWVFRNNITVCSSVYAYCGTGTSDLSAVVSDHNCYYGGGVFQVPGNAAATLAQWKTATGFTESGTITSNPNFTNAGGSFTLATDFQLGTGSPAKWTGTGVGLSTDYAGASWHSPPSMGVYEAPGPFTYDLTSTASAVTSVGTANLLLTRKLASISASATAVGTANLLMERHLASTASAVTSSGAAILDISGGTAYLVPELLWEYFTHFHHRRGHKQ